MTLREHMHGREGRREAERQIARGLRAWAVERVTPLVSTATAFCRETTIVFGTCRSDALRRASAPARLGEGVDGDITTAAEITSGWDSPVVWPLPFRVAV